MSKIAIADCRTACDEIAGELGKAAAAIEIQAEALAGLFCDLPDKQQLGNTGETLDGLIERLIDTADEIRKAGVDVVDLSISRR